MAAEDPVGGGAPGGREVELAALGVGDEAVGDEPAEHLARGLGRDPQVARDLRGGHATGVGRPGHDAQGEQVLLGGGGQVVRVVSGWHALRIRDRRGRPVPAPARRRTMPADEPDAPRR